MAHLGYASAERVCIRVTPRSVRPEFREAVGAGEISIGGSPRLAEWYYISAPDGEGSSSLPRLASSGNCGRITHVTDDARLFTRDFLLAIIINLFLAIVFFLLVTGMAVYAAEEFAAGETAAGFAASAFVELAGMARFHDHSQLPWFSPPGRVGETA